MNTFRNVTAIVILVLIFTCLTPPKVYGQSSESCELIFYRPAQGMMSGGAAAELKIFINDQEVGILPNGTMLNYTVFSQGTLKIKFVGIQMGSTVGTPKVINIEAKHGEIIAIEGAVKFPGGVSAEILNTKRHEKLKKIEWADTMKGKEDIEKPFIKTN